LSVDFELITAQNESGKMKDYSRDSTKQVKKRDTCASGGGIDVNVNSTFPAM